VAAELPAPVRTVSGLVQICTYRFQLISANSLAFDASSLSMSTEDLLCVERFANRRTLRLLIMPPHIEFEHLPEDHPDRLENSGMPKSFIDRLRGQHFTRLTDFDDMSDVEILRQPNVSGRMVKSIRAARERLVLPKSDP
jgi:hypothetical protein